MLPFSYQYSMSMAVEIINSIFKETHLEVNKEILKLPKEKVDVKLSKEFAMSVYPYTLKLANVKQTYGFTDQKHLQRLLKAVALSKGRTTVIEEDVKELFDIL